MIVGGNCFYVDVVVYGVGLRIVLCERSVRNRDYDLFLLDGVYMMC